MSRKTLFRPEVFAYKNRPDFAVILSSTPREYRYGAWGIGLVLVGMGLVFIFGSYTEKYVVTGYFNASEGMVSVFPSRAGVIRESYIHQGDVVTRGMPLFLLDIDSSVGMREEADELLQQLAQRKKALEAELVDKVNTLQRLKRLFDKHYISLISYDEQQGKVFQLEQSLNQVNKEMIHRRQARTSVIYSPVNGAIASVLYHSGQFVPLSRPMAKILPKNPSLVAELLVPVHQSGFLEKNHPVTLRCDAYPYERFGTIKGTIQQVGQSILTDAEENNPLTIGRPYYKVIVGLEKSPIRINGVSYPLRHGMTLTAVLIGSKRKIWQWVFDPMKRYVGDHAI